MRCLVDALNVPLRRRFSLLIVVVLVNIFFFYQYTYISSQSKDHSIHLTTIRPIHSELYGPKISIITVIYKARKHIAGFLEDVTKQTIFNQSELLLIDANSPDKEYDLISPYLSRFHNIRYLRLTSDPGLYEAWNIAIKYLARGKYITNFNVDDRKHYRSLEIYSNFLDSERSADVVCGSVKVTRDLSENFENSKSKEIWWDHLEGYLQVKDLFKFTEDGYVQDSENIPHNSPLWRKSLHDAVGYFDSQLTPVADWAFWLKALEKGHTIYKLKEAFELYYINLASYGRQANAPRIEGIKQSIIQQYRHNVRVKPTVSSAARHILIIHEHMLYLLEGGDHRLFQILRTLVNAGHHITFVHRGWSATKQAQDRLTDMGVELIGDEYYRSQGLNEVDIDDNKVLKDPTQFFRDRHFDAAILSTWFYKKNQTHHMIDSIPELYIPILQNLSPSTCIALATDDIHWIRNLDAAYCHSSETNCDRVLKSRERKVYESGDVIFTASESDARLITEWIPSLKSKPPLFIPYTAEPFDAATPFSINPFSQRDKLVYIGSTHSINVASLTWFFENVLPIISKTLHPFPKIHIVGKGWNEIPQFRQYESSGLVKFVGHLTEGGVKSILKTSLMFVNPMITGTGVSTKNVLALQSGVPLITTSFGIRGLMLEESYQNDARSSPGNAAESNNEQSQQQASWVNRDDLPVLVADSPDDFAYAIVKVAKNGKLWKTLSTKGLKHARDVLNSESQLEKLEFAIGVCLQRAAKRNNLRR